MREVYGDKHWAPCTLKHTLLSIIRPICNVAVFSVDFAKFTSVETFKHPTLYISFS